MLAPENSQPELWSAALYSTTYATLAIAVVAAGVHGIHLLQRNMKPSVYHITSICSLAIAALCALPYLWSKPIARFKLISSVIGWGVVALLLVIARFTGKRDEV